jgi:DNA invertase Pin-like site-specific DNA recombinase
LPPRAARRRGAGPPPARTAGARGRQGGRPSVITPELLAAAIAMRDKRELTMAQIARTLKIGRSTLYKHLDINHETNTEHDLAA